MRLIPRRGRPRLPVALGGLVAALLCVQVTSAAVVSAHRARHDVPVATAASYDVTPRDPRMPHVTPRRVPAPPPRPRPRPAPTTFVHRKPHAVPRKPAPRHRTDPLAALRGLSAWVDLHDYGKAGPAAAASLADTAAAHHVSTIWVETSRYNTPDIAYAAALSALVDRAAAHHIKVIAWVLPEFASVPADLAKARAAARFRSAGGHRFSALGLDIEVTSGAKAADRSARLLSLAQSLHHHIGMPLVAIVPPPVGFSRHPSYWPGFPWHGVAARADAIATMGYWSYSHDAEPGSYTRTELAQTRALVGRSSYPIHVIGGLAADTSASGVASFCRAARAYGAIGASLYDLASTPSSLWAPLQACRRVGH